MKNSEKTKLEGVLKIALSQFEDHRGFYVETFNKRDYAKKGIDIEFVEDDISVSRRHVLRGIHGDSDTWKLISCLQGSFYFVVVNNDPEHHQYKKWQAFSLSEFNRVQILVPPKFGNGHLAMTERTIFHYKQSNYYNPDSQFTIVWNNPEFNIWWPIDNPILSQRDAFGKIIK